MKSKALFLDRDGVINFKAPDHDYIKSWSEFRFVPNIAKAIKYAKDRDYLVIVITNQRGVARGLFSERDLQNIHDKIKENLEIDAFYYCIHDHHHNCDCRKPKPGLILQAAQDLTIDLAKSHMVGDSLSDIEAAHAAGITSAHLSQTNTSILDLVQKILSSKY